MHFFAITPAVLEIGAQAFADYSAALVCGPSAPSYLDGMSRDTGLDVIPGAVCACIGSGIDAADDVVSAVARASGRRRSTVAAVLDGFAGDDPAQHFWRVRAGRYSLLPRAANDAPPLALLAA